MFELKHPTPPCVWLDIDNRFTISEGDFLCEKQDDRTLYYECLGESELPGFLKLLRVEINENWEVVAEGSITNLAFFYIIENNFKILVPTNSETGWPSSVSEAIELLFVTLPKNQIEGFSQMAFEEFRLATFNLGQYIRNQFGMWIGNERLFSDAKIEIGKADELSEIILKGLYKKLSEKA